MKSLCLIFAGCLLLSLAACGGGGGGDSALTPQLRVSTLSLPSAQEGLNYSFELAADYGAGFQNIDNIFTWSVDAGSPNQLPTGLALNSLSGLISGTPHQGSAGSYSLLFSVNDGTDTATRTLALTVRSPDFADQDLDSLAAAGGGISGGAVTLGSILYARAVADEDSAPLANIGVAINAEDGSLIESAVTDAGGEVNFVLSGEVPHTITFADPVSNDLKTIYGNQQNPLRENVVAAFPRPSDVSLELTIDGLPAGEDLVVKLNGVPVATRNDIAASESVSVGAAVLNGILENAGDAWLMLVHVYDNTSDLPDQDDLLSASYVVDSDGTPDGSGQAMLSIDHGTGLGSDTEGVSTGLCTIAEATGTVTTPTPNILAGVVTLPRVSIGFENSFGTWEHSLIPFDIQNPPITTTFPYTVEYPMVPGAVSGGAFTSATRIGQVFVANATAIQAVLADPSSIADNLDSITGIPVIIRRSADTTLGAVNMSFTDLHPGGFNAVQTATAFYDVQSDVLSGETLEGMTGILLVEVDANTFYVSLDLSTSNRLEFTTVTTFAGSLPVTKSWLIPAAIDIAGTGGGFSDGMAILQSPIELASNVAGNGNTGSNASPILIDARVSSNGTLETQFTNPLEGSTFSLTGDSVTWDAGGLTPGNGGFNLEVVGSGMGISTRAWGIYLSSSATASAGSEDFSIKLPQLPTSAPFGNLIIEAAHEEMDLALRYVDLSQTSLDPNAISFRELEDLAVVGLDLSFDFNDLFLPDLIAQMEDVFAIQFGPQTMIDPE